MRKMVDMFRELIFLYGYLFSVFRACFVFRRDFLPAIAVIYFIINFETKQQKKSVTNDMRVAILHYFCSLPSENRKLVFRTPSISNWMNAIIDNVMLKLLTQFHSAGRWVILKNILLLIYYEAANAVHILGEQIYGDSASIGFMSALVFQQKLYTYICFKGRWPLPNLLSTQKNA